MRTADAVNDDDDDDDDDDDYDHFISKWWVVSQGTLIPRSSTQGRGIKISPQNKCYKNLCYFLQSYKLEILMRILWTRLDRSFTVLDKTNFKENMQ